MDIEIFTWLQAGQVLDIVPFQEAALYNPSTLTPVYPSMCWEDSVNWALRLRGKRAFECFILGKKTKQKTDASQLLYKAPFRVILIFKM